jgi:hypothetical protein
MQKMYEKVADVVKSKQGIVAVNDPDLDAVLMVNGKSTKYRLATYMWEIRTKMNLAVVPVRTGRMVTSYEVPAFKVVAALDAPVAAVAAVAASL